jgi:hypothetical protein
MNEVTDRHEPIEAWAWIEKGLVFREKGVFDGLF